MTDEPKSAMTDGTPVYDGHKELKPNGQQKGYVALSEAERAKGFVRPLHRKYQHVGRPGPVYPLFDLTDKQASLTAGEGYVKFEKFPESIRPATGKYWTKAELDIVGVGCGTVTTIGSTAIIETFARLPGYYGGTFCVGCGKHLPLTEFVWVGTDDRVGS